MARFPARLALTVVLLGIAVAALPQEVVKRKKKVERIPPQMQALDPPKPRPLPQPSPSPSPGPLPPSPIPQPGPRPDPAPPGTGLAAGVLRGKLGEQGLGNFLDQFKQATQSQSGCGRNFRCQDPWFDKAAQPPPNTPVVRPQGTDFFRSGFTPPSESESLGTVSDYGGQPGGGVVLEGVASGLRLVERLGYDPQFNALVLDGQAVYFIRMPPRTFTELCRALAQDRRAGVSLGQRRLAYGKVPKDSALAFDLTLADKFLGDIVFARDDWASGYRLAGGYSPRTDAGFVQDMAVFFRFRGYAFEVRQREVVPTAGRLDVSLIPLSGEIAPDGNSMPDFAAIRAGRLPPQYEANARHLAENMQHYRREQIVQRAFLYGEAAALLRWLQSEGVDLDELAAQIR